MIKVFHIFFILMITATFSVFSQSTNLPGAPDEASRVETMPLGKYTVPNIKGSQKDGEQLQAANPYATTVFTFSDIVVFSYFTNTSIEIYNSANVLVDSYTIGLDEYHNTTLPQGIYRVEGNKSYSVLVGDPISEYVLGYYAVNENGYALSTKLNTYMPTQFSTDKFLIFAYQDGTEYTLKNLTTGVTISAGLLNEGQWYEYNGHNVFLQVLANKPVAALTYNDQGYMIPSSNGSFSGTKFYSYVGTVGGWTNGIIVTAYHNNTNVTIKNLQTNALIFQGVLNEGQVHAIPTNQQIYFSVETDKNVTVGNHPYAGYTCCYAYMMCGIDRDGFGIGTLFYIPTIANRFDVFSYEDGNNVKITRMDNNQVVYDNMLNQGEGFSFTSVKAVYKVESTKNATCVISNSGTAGADFMPLNYSTTLTDLSISTPDIMFNPDPVVENAGIVLSAKINNLSQVVANSVLVRFYLGDPSMNGIQIGPDQLIPTINPNSNATVSVNWTVPEDADGQYIFVVIDPLGTIQESNESNNKAGRALIPNNDLLPPLSIQINAPFALDLVNNVLAPNPFTVEAVIFNNGTVAATDVVAEMLALPVGLELDPSSNPMLINVGNIAGRQSAVVNWKLKANGLASGFLKYSMRFDASNADEKNVSRQINIPDIIPPAAPTGLQVVSSANGTIVLSWNPNSEPDLFGYQLFYDNDGSGAPYDGMDADEGPSPINIGNLTTFTLNGLDPTKVYFFALKAFDTRPNYSGYSNEAQSTVEEDCPVVILTAPLNNAQIVFSSPQSIDYSWLPAQGASHYQIQISAFEDFSTIFHTNTTVNTTYNYTSSAYAMTSYWWRVRMWDGDEYCSFSPPRKFTLTDASALTLNLENQYECQGVPFILGTMDMIQGGSGDYSIFWHPAEVLSDPNIQNPVAVINFTLIFTLTVFDNITGEMVYGTLTVFIIQPPYITAPSLYRHPKNTVLDLNSIISITGGTPPYTTSWFKRDGTPIPDPTNYIPPVGGNVLTVYANDQTACASISRRVTVYVPARKESGDIATGLNNNSFLFANPNPVESNVEITAAFAESQNLVTVKILDLLGNELYRKVLSTGYDLDLSIDMNSLSAGVYMLVLDSGNDIIVKKLMKQ